MGVVIDFDLSTVLFLGLVWVGAIIFLKFKKRKDFTYLLFFTVFYVYMAKLIDVTQFPMYFSESMRINIGQNVWGNMNLMPFFTITEKSTITSALNILITIPFGFGMPFISGLRARGVVIAGCATSLLLEFFQFIIALMAGFTFRVVDINDVIFNTFGVIIGYMIFVGFVRICRFAVNKFGICQNDILKYVLGRPQIK
jgi:glycopeptide antibiotics resistance protein